tara:strand:+ start:4417 stop:4572 length:156 start_codon:yes stop_codon:yes gene_type:complete
MANKIGDDEAHIRAELRRVLNALRRIMYLIEGSIGYAKAFPGNHPDVRDFF